MKGDRIEELASCLDQITYYGLDVEKAEEELIELLGEDRFEELLEKARELRSRAIDQT